MAAGVGGFLLGARAHPAAEASAAPSPPATGAPMVVHAAGGAPQAAASEDCQGVRTQLAICMAYHPPPDEKDMQLHMCRAEVDACRSNPPTLPAC
jgi:hypothetical protein